MTGAVLNPGLGSASSQRDRDERRAQVVDPDRAAKRGALEQLGTIDASELQVRSEHAGRLRDRRRGGDADDDLRSRRAICHDRKTHEQLWNP